MFWFAPVSWTPHDEAELIAGWRLWLELGDRTWPSAAWDGTAADVVKPLRELVAACDEIETGYRDAVDEPSDEFIRIIQFLVWTVSTVIELWADDEVPLDADRIALLHSDLAGFAEQAERVLALLAVSGGWTGLAAEHRRTGR